MSRVTMLSLVGTCENSGSFSSVETSLPFIIKKEESEKANEENQQFREDNWCKHVCEECNKTFCNISDYEKHRYQYSGKHKYFKCCNKVEDFESSHKCKRTPLKSNSMEKNQVINQHVETNNKVKVSVSDGNNDDKDYVKDNNYVHGYMNENENKQDNNDESDSEDIFDENKTKNKKVKARFNQNNESKCKIYKCQECLELFSKYTNLLQHSKIIHKKQGKFKCPICDEDFNSNEDFKFHKAMHGPEDKIMCKGCKKTFNTLKLYYIHAKQNPVKHSFLCKLCLRKFSTEFMLEQHVCICQNGKPLQCACGKEFTKYKDVIDHSKGTKPFSCCSCPHLANSLTAYIRHLRKHSKQKPYQCTKCDMKFAVIDFLNIHNKKCHIKNESEPLTEENSCPNQVEEYVCNFCKNKFGTSEDLSKHISKAHDQKKEVDDEKVQCPDCGKLLKKNRLDNHRNTHKTSASLCPECGKLFDTRFKLTQHIITTHNNDPVKCEVCMKVLKTKKILNEHMKTHLKSELGRRIPQAICPMCGLGLAQKGSLARHILLTHEKHKIVPCDKSYTCPECSAILPNRAKYYSHRRMHRAMVDRFPCQVCGREFNKKQNLKRHMYLLHDETRVLADPIFKCQFCTRCFREKKNLKRHYKMIHKVDDIV